jgi:cytochrome d ubiquinol oxidase subunit I
MVHGQLRFTISIPHGLALLARGDPNATISGLDTVPPRDRPQAVTLIHLAFDTMVAAGLLLLALGAWLGATWLRHRGAPSSRWFLRGAVLAGPAAVVAMECGWITTEVGRQPWIVYRIMRVEDAVNPAPGLALGLVVLIAVYSVLTAVTIIVLRRLARTAHPTAAVAERL